MKNRTKYNSQALYNRVVYEIKATYAQTVYLDTLIVA